MTYAVCWGKLVSSLVGLFHTRLVQAKELQKENSSTVHLELKLASHKVPYHPNYSQFILTNYIQTSTALLLNILMTLSYLVISPNIHIAKINAIILILLRKLLRCVTRRICFLIQNKQKKWYLKILTLKIKVKVLETKRKKTMIHSSCVQCSSHTMYLGVCIDDMLHFTKHIWKVLVKWCYIVPH